MLLATASELTGVGSIPTSKRACLAWLKRNGINPRPNGNVFFFPVSDLPEPERLAWQRKTCDELHLEPGTYDEAAHAAFMEASPSLRERAERKAAMARLLVSLAAEGHGWPDRLHLVRARFPAEAVSKPSLKRLLAAVKGVDPINYAPATAAGLQRQHRLGRSLGRGLAVLCDHDPGRRARAPALAGMARRARRGAAQGLGLAVLANRLSPLAGAARGAADRGAARPGRSGQAAGASQ
nr:hypothetical protein [Rhodovulum sp. BSW8]